MSNKDNTISVVNTKVFSTEIGGKELKIEIGKYAHQTNASCTVQYGETVVLATVCMSKSIREGIDFFPLMVDYDEKLYAAGKIKGSRFIKREGRASDEAILSGRLIDRSIRPLFNDTLRNDVQVVISVLSFDMENDADVIALNAASCVLAISDIPWNGPIAAVRVGRIKSKLKPDKFEFVLNPTYEQRKKSDLDLVVSATKDEAVMIEAGAKEIPEDVMYEAIKFAMKHLKDVLKVINEAVKKTGKEKINLVKEVDGEEQKVIEMVKNKVREIVSSKIKEIFSGKLNKKEYTTKVDELKVEVNEILRDDNDVSKEARNQGLKVLEDMLFEATRDLVLNKKIRVDGRGIDKVRDLSAEVSLFPRTHGSGLFQRGETQVLSVVTLGSPSDEQTLDTMEEDSKKRYMHHYNFPGFSVGETRPMRGPGRREIGHGALAEKALLPVLPSKEEFPYTIRVVSEVLGSNGSSSQASICGSSLSLMDAGVPIKKPVAGIAMGLITDSKNRKKYEVLTDIQGIEDHSGDMDFKVAGTKDGITAIQLDIKLDGITMKVVEETLKKAKLARLHILDVMKQAITEPRKELSKYAPRIYTLHIDPEKIKDVIGPGGKMINEIIDKTGVAIDIEQDGNVFVSSTTSEGADEAIEWIKNLTKEVEAGEIYQGKVTRLMDFGAFVEVLPGKEGLVHVSEMAPFRVGSPADAVKEGDTVPVKVKEIDSQGRINLTFIGTDFDFSKIKKSNSVIRPRRNFNGPRRDGNGLRRPFNRGGGRNFRR